MLRPVYLTSPSRVPHGVVVVVVVTAAVIVTVAIVAVAVITVFIVAVIVALCSLHRCHHLLSSPLPLPLSPSPSVSWLWQSSISPCAPFRSDCAEVSHVVGVIVQSATSCSGGSHLRGLSLFLQALWDCKGEGVRETLPPGFNLVDKSEKKGDGRKTALGKRRESTERTARAVLL